MSPLVVVHEVALVSSESHSCETAPRLRADLCLLDSLAYAQLYIVLACILRRFELSLHDVIYERDVEAKRDCFIGEPDLDNHGVHVTLKQMLA